MRFAQILGNCNKEIILASEKKLSVVLLELATSYENKSFGTKLGGDVFLYQIVTTVDHICDARSLELSSDIKILDKNIVTSAATNGKYFWWSPTFILDKSLIGLRLILNHEGSHIFYMHPARRGLRNQKLWNIAVDFKVNFLSLEDLRARKHPNPEGLFRQELGEFITLNEYIQFLKDPFKPPVKLDNCGPISIISNMLAGNGPQNITASFFYAEPNLSEKLRSPEAIYDVILHNIPGCNVCNKVGIWEKTEEYKELENKFFDKNPDASRPAIGLKNNCPACSKNTIYFDPFGFGELVDQHMDFEISQTDLSKKLQNAQLLNKQLGGKLSGDTQKEIDNLSKPVLTWQDFVRTTKLKKQEGSSKNNWNSPRRKLLFSGLFVPKKIDYKIKFLLAYDCSGSMNNKQIAYGISQIQILAESAEGWCLPWDGNPFFDSIIKLKDATASSLKNARFKGGGGTVLSSVFHQYPSKIGHVDIVMIISDFYLADFQEVAKLKQPSNTDVIWLSVNGNPNFHPPFGRIFRLFN